MPLHPVALEVLQRVGPMAVIAANRSGQPAPRNCEAAEEQLGSTVSIYLDAGELPEAEPSTVVDLSEKEPRLLRPGAYSVELLRSVAPDMSDETDENRL
jgi:tRNA A37 threonylcarbamoyladenosine synthetase subunit TsaC/SUA5/YrdC